jgi:hypothetical protein
MDFKLIKEDKMIKIAIEGVGMMIIIAIGIFIVMFMTFTFLDWWYDRDDKRRKSK